MDAPSAPAAPDPKVTAQAQSGMNRDTAIAQMLTNSVNQVTPNGNLTYNQTGSNSYTDADGKQVSIPQLTATQTFSPDQQKLFDLNNQTKQNIGQIGVDQSSRIGSLLNTPVNLNNEATEARLYELGSKRLDPRFEQERSSMESQLVNRGIRPGTEAYDREVQRFDQTKNDAYNQLLLTGRGQATQEALTERNQPINEISALMSGSQVSQPNFAQTPTAGVAPTDYIGAVNQKHQSDLAAYNAQQKQQMGLMSGLFNGASSAAMWAFSDERAKEDIDLIGVRPDGLGVYEYEYKPEMGLGDARQVGLMAQEVAQVYPKAVATVPGSGGLMAVNYADIPRAA